MHFGHFTVLPAAVSGALSFESQLGRGPRWAWPAPSGLAMGSEYQLPTIRGVTPILACLPVFTFFAALGLLAVAVVLVGAHNGTDEPEAGPRPQAEWTWQWTVAIVITIVVPLLMLLMIWFAPDW
jgi:hypothetical protein